MATSCCKSCCLVCDLKTGSIIMGSLNAIFSFFMVCVIIAAIYNLEPVRYVDGEKKDMTEEVSMTGVYVMSIMLMIMLAFKFVFEVLFVYGVVTEYAQTIRSYLIMWIVFFIVAIIIFFLNAHHFNLFTKTMEIIYGCFNFFALCLFVIYMQIFHVPFQV